MVFPVTIRSVKEARRCNEVATEQEFAIYISCDNIMIDVRSLLGLMTLIGKTGVLVAPAQAEAGFSVEKSAMGHHRQVLR